MLKRGILCLAAVILFAGRVLAAESAAVTAEEVFARAAAVCYPEADFGERVGIAAVVQNRMRTAGFPDTCGEVLTHFGDGEFFAMDRIASPVEEEILRMSREAWMAAAAGWDPTGGALYFHRQEKAPLEWTFTFDDTRESRQKRTAKEKAVIGQTVFW